MRINLRRFIAWALASTGLVGVVLSYYAVWVLVEYFAAGLVWVANVALFFSGPVAVSGGLLACRRPRYFGAIAVGFFGLAAWVVLWVLMFTVLGFKWLPAK